MLIGDLEDNRHTQGECTYSTELYEHNDNWRTDRLPLRAHFRLPWFGQTKFRVKPEVVEDMKAEAAAEEARRRSRGREEKQEKKPEEKKDEEMREAPEAPQAPEDLPEVVEVHSKGEQS